MYRMLAFWPALLLALWSFGAAAQSGANRDTCASGGSPGHVAAACTRLITRGWLAEEELGLAFKRRGDARYKLDDNDRAIDDYSEALRINPRHVDAYIKRGEAWIRSARYDNDRALADFNEALRIDPKAATAYVGRGTAWYNKHDYDRAIADLNEALRLDPQNAGPYRVRAHAWSAKLDYDRFLADLNEALRINPGYMGVYIDRGRFWEYKHDYARALTEYSEAVRINPSYSIAQNAAAWLLATAPVAAIRNGARAVELATKAVEGSYPGNARFLDTLAAAYAESGNFALAVRLQEKVLESAELMKSSDGPGARQRLALYRKHQPYRLPSKP